MSEIAAESVAASPHQQAANAVANWWADKAGIVTGNGDQSDRGGFTTALAVLAGAQGQTIAPSKREAFVEALSRRVAAELDRQTDRGYSAYVAIGMDYGPDRMLAEAAQEAGVPTGAFPWKTMTWAYPTHVVCSLGYQGRRELVWSADDWERPLCGAGKYGPAPEYDRLPWKCSGLLYHDDEHTFDVPEPLCIAKVRGYDDSLIPCNRPDGGDYHDNSDGYTSRNFHDFWAPAEVSQ